MLLLLEDSQETTKIVCLGPYFQRWVAKSFDCLVSLGCHLGFVCSEQHQGSNCLSNLSARIALSCGKRGFAETPWDTMVGKYGSDGTYKSLVEAARAVMHGTASLDAPKASVADKVEVQLQIERQVVVLSEKELRKHSKMYRIGKTKLQGIPCLEVPCDTGVGTELVYMFADDSSPHRRAKLTVSTGTLWSSSLLEHGAALHAEQGANMHAFATQTKSRELGVAEFLEKEAGGHLSLVSVQDFIDKKLSKPAADADDERPGAGMEQQTSTNEDDAVTLVGVVAQPASLTTTPLGKRKESSPSLSSHKLQRTGSANSVLGLGLSEVGSELSGGGGWPRVPLW